MILATIILSISTVAFTLPLAINPLSLGLIILFLALLLATSFSTSISSWVASLIFLIYIGGILVIFAYFVAIIPNQTLSIIYILSIIVLIISTISIIIYSLNLYPKINYSSIQINFMYTRTNLSTLIILAIILLFTIVVVVKIATNNKGPLRPFIYV